MTKSCRQTLVHEACRYYVKTGSLSSSSKDISMGLCKLNKKALHPSAISVGCDSYMEPLKENEFILEEILSDTSMTDKEKYSKIYFDYNISELSYGSSVFLMLHKTTNQIRYIFGNPKNHEIVNQFNIQDDNIIEKHSQRIPTPSIYFDHDNLYQEVAYAYNNNLPMALWGHTGTGKSELIKQFAAIIGAPVYRVNFNGMTTTDDIIGKLLPAGNGEVKFQDGGVTECVRHGGILLLEELNACSQEVLFSLHGLIDGFASLVLVEKDNEIVNKHIDCHIFATLNPSEYVYLYPGTKDLSQAFASRWPIFRHVSFLPDDIEAELLKKNFGFLSSTTIKQMVKVAHLSRKLMDEGKLTFVFSARVLKNWAQLSERFGILAAAELSFIGHMDSSSRAIMITEVLDVATKLDISELKIKYVR